MSLDFKVGKKYRIVEGGEKATAYTCVYVTDISKLSCCAGAVAVLKWPGGAERSVSRDLWPQWEEVVEPHREFFNAYKQTKDEMGDNITPETYYRGPYSTRNVADIRSGMDRYGVLELVHHSDTKVESIFHLVPRARS